MSFDSNLKRNKIHMLPIVAVILVMGLIFLLSSQPETQSDQLSRGLAKLFISIAKDIMSDCQINLNSLNHLLRKTAHFSAYFLLGLLGINALRKNSLRTYRSVIAILLLCVLYALSDEAHQLFVPGRGAQIRDVVIDSAGAAAGILTYMIIAGLWRLKTHLKSGDIKQ